MNFDYVIVGGGSAGCVIANRLVSAGASVCVLEAGPVDRNPFIHIPAGFIRTLFNPAVTWQFRTEPTEWTGGRSLITPQGRTLGGSSSVNGMVFVRGQANDYNMWAQKGNLGWDYAGVLPYFRKIERRLGPHDPVYRGAEGLLPVTDTDWKDPLCEAFIAGAESVGIPRNDDYNGVTQEGAGYYQRVIHKSRRVSAARAYLYPVLKHPKLSVITDAMVARLTFEGSRAVGALYRRGGASAPLVEVRANKEVIVTAGAVNSPKLLQLSGIGNPELLRAHGIPVVHALPAVGENLSDHYSPRTVASVKNIETINNMVTGHRLLGQMVRWATGRPSVLALSAAVVHAFGRSDAALDAPDYTLIFTPASYKEGVLGQLDSYPGMTCGAWQMRPESTGHVRIVSADPMQAPIVQPNYLSAERDREVLLKAIRMGRKVLRSAPMAQYFDAEKLPGAQLERDDELLDFARKYGSSTYHLCGACRMGPASDRSTVVDDRLRVHGVAGLRVADSSVIPAIVSANTYATTLMIGEKVSDMILGRSIQETSHAA